MILDSVRAVLLVAPRTCPSRCSMFGVCSPAYLSASPCVSVCTRYEYVLSVCVCLCLRFCRVCFVPVAYRSRLCLCLCSISVPIGFIRFHGLLDDDMSVVLGKGQYSFANIFNVFDFLLSIGVKVHTPCVLCVSVYFGWTACGCARVCSETQMRLCLYTHHSTFQLPSA